MFFHPDGENANERNLITGTRYFNVDGMLPFENMIADYVKETENHVLFRVTPIYEGNDLVARGVLMEAYSVEDKGDGICFNVFVYNVQPGITIDYATGENYHTKPSSGTTAATTTAKPNDNESQEETVTYVLNKSSGKFHLPTCSSLPSEKNRIDYKGEEPKRDKDGNFEYEGKTYMPCVRCHP